MSDNLLERYMGKRPESSPTGVQETEGLEEFGAFGWLRGIRDRAIMLEIRHRDGRITAFGYAWLDLVEYDPSEGITLRFSGKSVKIIGSHLNTEIRSNIRLLDGIIRQRVPWIAEMSGASFSPTSRGEPQIEEIQVL